MVNTAAVEALQAEVDRLTTENAVLRLCPSFGIYTRAAIELSWKTMAWQRLAIVYADLDDLKQMNTIYRCEGVNERIRAAFAQIRSSEIACARWMFGDELVFIMPASEARSAAARIQQAFADQGLGMTLAIVRCLCPELRENVSNAQFLVEWSKGLGRKGGVLSVLFGEEKYCE